MNEALAALHAVQELDTALLRVARKLRSLDPGTALAQAAEEAARTHAEAAAALHSAEADLRDSELELKSVEAKRKDHSDRLYSGKVTNPKELDGMQHEIEALGRRRGALDEHLLELMETVENLSSREAELRRAADAAREAYEAKAAVTQREEKTLRAEAVRLKTLRAERAALVPSALLKRYDAVRTGKDGVGLACIEDGRCGACRTVLPRNTVLTVRDSVAIVTCEACGRLLCMRQPEP